MKNIVHIHGKIYIYYMFYVTPPCRVSECVLVAVVRNQIACEYMLFVKSFGNFSADKCRSNSECHNNEK